MQPSSKKSRSPKNKNRSKRLTPSPAVRKTTKTSVIEAFRSQFKAPQYFLWGAVCLIITAVLLAYSNSFFGEFLFDDGAVIKDNPTLQHL